MPIYEYTCHDCHRRVSLLWRSFAEAQSRQPICPRCDGANLTRVVSRVAFLRSEGTALADPSNTPDIDENDPKSLAKFMRQMARETASETGEDLGPEFEEVVGRLEAGEDPEEIEKSMPEFGDDSGVGDPRDPRPRGGLAGSSAGGDDFGVM